MDYKLQQNPVKAIFRAYDIRGVVGEGIDVDTIYSIGLAIGSEAIKQGETEIVAACDGRLSAPELFPALCQGLAATGLQVEQIGAVPSPVLYFAAATADKTNSGVMLTASHNPPNYNGIKTVIKGKTLVSEQVQMLLSRIQDNDITYAENSGAITKTTDIIDRYIKRVTDEIVLAKPLKVVVDCANGITGPLAPQTLRKLGCEVIELYTEVDGRFPNHEPDPTILDNLSDLIAKVKETGADIGLAFDGDGDRLGVITEDGDIIWPDRQLMLFSKEVLTTYPGRNIIFDVKCSEQLAKLIRAEGGTPIISRTGHSLIKKAMFEHKAPLAGEMSGHIFFNDRWYGFDDGLYTAARLLEILAGQDQSVGQLFADFGDTVNTPEIKIAIADEDKFSFIEKIQQANFEGGNVIDIDGVRVSFNDGWGLLRASNTSPYLTSRFEADDEHALARIQALFREKILQIDPRLKVSF